jgi:membrane protein implicated in regulation of membrane protease activity
MKNIKLSHLIHFKLRMDVNTFLALTVFLLCTLPFSAISQVQRGLPKPTDPIDLSKTNDLVIFVVLPALVIVLIFFWRRAIKKRDQKRKENE